MSRLIDADALMEKVQDIGDGWRMIDENDVLDAPTIDAVEVKHGHWIRNDRNGFKIYDCSVCGIHIETDGWNYCPNCGAKMDEVTE